MISSSPISVAACCSMLQYVAVCEPTLCYDAFAVCCSVSQCVAACCSVLQYVAVCESRRCATGHLISSSPISVAACPNALQCVAACCSKLQYVRAKLVLQDI